MTKEPKLPAYFIIIRWSKEAIETATGHSFLKHLIHVQNGQAVAVERYAPWRVKELEREGLVVKDMTEQQAIPKDAQLYPLIRIPLGVIQLRRRL